MIEFTTGMALIVSSMYMVGSTPAYSANIAKAVATTSSEAVYSTTTDKVITSSKDVEKYVREQYVDEPILVDIARCESTFRQYDADGTIMRGKVNRADVGVMQINEKYHADKATELGINIYTVEGNVAYAKYLYDKYGAEPWSSSSKCWSQSDVLAINR